MGSKILSPLAKRGAAFLLACTFGLSSLSNAKTVQSLNIGDKVPEISFDDMINYNHSTAKISQFRGRPIIIDFWATWCSNCVNNFPHLDSLNKIFNGDIQFLLINSKNTGDSKAKALGLFDKLKTRNVNGNFSLPSTVGDTLADKLFQHTMIPHYVWIDPNGIIKYVTSSEEVNYDNLNDFKKGNAIAVHLKKDIFNFDPQKPLFFPDNTPFTPVIKSRVMITGYAEGLVGMSGGSVDSLGRYTRLFCTNSPILNLYIQAIPQVSKLLANRIVLNVDKPAIFETLDWDKRVSSFFCFEIISPPTTIEKIREKMKIALDDYFKVQTFLKDTIILCYEIRNARGYKSVHQATANLRAGPDQIILEQTSMGQIIGYLNDHSSVPIVDQTEIEKPVTITLPRGKLDFQKLHQSVEKYGFTIDSLHRKMTVFVIQQQSENN